MASSFGAPEVAHVQLGETIYDVVPQPLPFLEDKLGGLFEGLTSGSVNLNTDAGIAGLVRAVTGGAHTLLGVFITDLMPIYKWQGYRSQEEMDEKVERDPEHVRAVAPTGPQVKLAISECFRVNGLDMWDSLKSLVDPTLLQSMVTDAIESAMREAKTRSPEESSPTSS